VIWPPVVVAGEEAAEAWGAVFGRATRQAPHLLSEVLPHY